jgi:release factor glutamine methyltransferase
MSATATVALRDAAERLRAAGIADPGGDARRLLAWALGRDRAGLAAALPDPLPGAAAARFGAAIDARAARRPVARIVGERLFWGRSFRVTDAVLDPRPETETLVAAALELPWRTVLDLGTGSGAILVSLLADRPAATGAGTDACPAALAVAAENAARHGVAGRARLIPADWFPAGGARVDLIVANPPYIPSADIAGLAPEVRDHDPRAALDGGADGLDPYRAILGRAAPFLTPGGHVLLEHGPDQAPAIGEIAVPRGLGAARSLADMDGRPRALCLGPVGRPPSF